MKPKPKIYISHPRLPIEEVAKRAGVSKRRLKALLVIADNLIESEAPRRPTPAGKPSAHKRTKRAVGR
jgi:hypothetical protein